MQCGRPGGRDVGAACAVAAAKRSAVVNPISWAKTAFRSFGTICTSPDNAAISPGLRVA